MTLGKKFRGQPEAAWRPDAVFLVNWLFLAGSWLSLLLLVHAILQGDSQSSPLIASIFRISCHQIPSRCFTIHGIVLPICARCLGVWLGIAAASLVRVTGLRRINRSLCKHASLFMVILVCDWILGFILFPASWKIWRAITGFLGGMGMTAIIQNFLASRLSRFPVFRHL